MITPLSEEEVPLILDLDGFFQLLRPLREVAVPFLLQKLAEDRRPLERIGGRIERGPVEQSDHIDGPRPGDRFRNLPRRKGFKRPGKCGIARRA